MTPAQPEVGMAAFHVMAKPIGPLCNLDCKYCFYLEKTRLFAYNENFRMRDEVLESYIRQYIDQQVASEVVFTWQGGEPTILGVDFFRRAIELQRKYARGKSIANVIQTNGTMLDDKWAEFLAEKHFLVGVSIDGPPKVHNRYRVTKKGGTTYEQVAHGIKFLIKHGVEFNTLTVVNRLNSKKPLEVYRFLKQIGSGFIQFIPLVERLANVEAGSLGLDLAFPPSGVQNGDVQLPVTNWSVEPGQYGEFLVTIFDEWVKNDVGRVFVQLFDVTLGNWLGEPSGLCLFGPICGTAVALEHNGDVYSCDHYVYPKYRLGNLLDQDLARMVNSDPQRRFGRDKTTALPNYCRDCDVLFLCHGECPKHRFLPAPDGSYRLNYLCRAYQRFFRHSAPAMQIMANLLRARHPAADIMSGRTPAGYDLSAALFCV